MSKTTLSLLSIGLLLLVSARPQDPTASPQSDCWKQKLERARDLMSTGEIPRALELARAALTQAEHELDNDEDLVPAILFLSTVLIMSADYDAAEPHAQRAHGIAEEQLEKARSRVATTLKYLGAIHSQTGNLEAAQRVYERAVEISEAAVGPDHPETAKHVGNLGALFLRRDQNEKAEELLERSLAIWDQYGSPNPVYTVSDLCNLAQLRIRQDQPEEALELYARGVAIQERAFQGDDPRLQSTLRDYAAVLREFGHEEEAAEIEQRIP
jgi:tetratricopeptide (TPR) repeat protein